MSLIMLLWFLSLIYPFIVHLVLIMHFVFTFHELGVFVWREEDRFGNYFFLFISCYEKGEFMFLLPIFVHSCSILAIFRSRVSPCVREESS
jgi:hypothetical protein